MLTRWDPFAELARFDADFFGPQAPQRNGRSVRFVPAVDIVEHESGLTLTAELPGVSRDDVSIEFHDGVLTIQGTRESKHDTSKGALKRTERAYGKFTRSFRLPKDIDAEQIRASMSDGLLTVELTKVPEVQPKRIAIN